MTTAPDALCDSSATPLVVGLDLSMRSTGIAGHDGVTTAVRPRSEGDERLSEIRARCHHWCVTRPDTPVDLVVIEDLPTHARAAGITGMVHGAVRTMLHRRGLRYVTVPPASLKKYATGHGAADKAQMADAAWNLHRARFGTDDECDAAWLRWLGLAALTAGVPIARNEPRPEQLRDWLRSLRYTPDQPTLEGTTTP